MKISDQINFFQITYETVGVVQMTFLRLLSSYAYQNFTLTCVQSKAWFDEVNLNHDKAIRLKGQEDVIFSMESNQPDVLSDGCAVSTDINISLLMNIV